VILVLLYQTKGRSKDPSLTADKWVHRELLILTEIYNSLPKVYSLTKFQKKKIYGLLPN
jgi:hypothetical protein